MSIFVWKKNPSLHCHSIWPLYSYTRKSSLEKTVPSDSGETEIRGLWITSRLSFIRLYISRLVTNFLFWPFITYHRDKIEQCTKVSVVGSMITYTRTPDSSDFAFGWRFLKRSKKKNSFSFELNPLFYYDVQNEEHEKTGTQQIKINNVHRQFLCGTVWRPNCQGKVFRWTY